MALFLLWGMAIQMAFASSAFGPIDGDFQPIGGGVYLPGQTMTASFDQDLPPFTMIFSVAGAPTVATAISPSGTQQEYALLIPSMIAENVELLVDISTGTVHSTFPIGNFQIAQPTGVNSASSGSAGQATTPTTPTSTPTVTPVTVFVSSLSTSSASTLPPAASPASAIHKSSIPAIVGGLIGGITITLIVGAVLLFVRNRRRRIRTTSGWDHAHRDRSSSELILSRFQTEPAVVEDGPAPVEDNADDQPNASSRWSLRVNLGRYARHASRKAPPVPVIMPSVPPEVPQLAPQINERMNLPEFAAADEKENLRAREEGLLPPPPHPDFEMDEADAAATAIAFHHQDSGIRATSPADMDAQVRNQVIEFPPAYSAV